MIDTPKPFLKPCPKCGRICHTILQCCEIERVWCNGGREKCGYGGTSVEIHNTLPRVSECAAGPWVFGALPEHTHPFLALVSGDVGIAMFTRHAVDDHPATWTFYSFTGLGVCRVVFADITMHAEINPLP